MKTAEELTKPLKEYKDYFVVSKDKSIKSVLTELYKKINANPEEFKKATSSTTDKVLSIIDGRWEQVKQNAIKLHKLSGEALTNSDNRHLRKHSLGELQKYSSMLLHADNEQRIIKNVLQLVDAKKKLDTKELEEVFAPIAQSRLNSNATQELQRSNSNISFSSAKTESSSNKMTPPKLKGEIKKSPFQR